MSLTNSKFFGSYLISHQGVDAKLIFSALELQKKMQPSLEELARSCCSLEAASLIEILNKQVQSHKPFEDTAIELGLLSEGQVSHLQKQQLDCRKKLGDILVDMGVFTEDAKASLLKQYNSWLEAAAAIGRSNSSMHK